MTTRVSKGTTKTTYRVEQGVDTDMSNKPQKRWRIVCPNFGTRGHSTHRHNKATLERAIERAEGNDRLYEHLAKGDDQMYSYYRSEIGWKVQVKTVTEWEEVT